MKNTIPINTPIYRYLSTESFIHFRMFNKIRFAPIKAWIDTNEGKKYELILKNIKNKNLPSLDNIFGSSWTLEIEDSRLFSTSDEHLLANEELEKNGSASMWENYCPRGGLRIKTTIQKLLNIIKENDHYKLLHEQIRYEPLRCWNSYGSVKKVEDLLFIKPISFRHEKEYRFFLISKKSNQEEILFEVENIFDFIDEVLVSPTTSKYNQWISDALYKLGWSLSVDPQNSNPINSKNGKQYCRISRLYGLVSEIIR